MRSLSANGIRVITPLSSRTKFSFLSLHNGRMTASRYLLNSSIEYGSGFRTTFPLSAFAISRISLISPNRNLEDVSIFCRFSCAFCGRSISSVKYVRPMMPLSGVRISWLMRERKSVLASLASSAFLRSCFSTSSCILTVSCRLTSSVTSWKAAYRICLPFWGSLVRTLSCTQRYTPSLPAIL